MYSNRGAISNILDPKKFNLTALLQSGRYYLDESGLLVAPNGTRYRIPSGPPEGRKPLRLDKPKPTAIGGIKQPIKNVEQLVSEQQDSSKYVQSKPEVSQFIGFTSAVQTTPKPMVDSHWSIMGTSPGIDQSSASTNQMQSMDWTIVLLSLIVCSISLACNLGLIVLISFKLRRTQTNMKHTSESDRLHEEHHRPTNHRDEYMDSVHTRNSYYRPSIRNRCDMNEINWCPPHQDCNQCSTEVPSIPKHLTTRRHRHRLRSRKGHSNSRNGWTPSKMDERLQRGFPRDPRTRISQDQGSSSGGSWKMALSDGVMSETTGDDGETTEDSGTNSDVMMYHTPHRRRYWQHVRSAENRRYKACHSDSTPEGMVNLSVTPGARVRISPSTLQRHLETIRSTTDSTPTSDQVAEEDLEENSSELMSAEEYILEQQRHDWFENSIYVTHTLGIHTGLLGLLLCVIQLVAVCSALRQHMISSNRHAGMTPMNELVSVLSTSLAADTIICARQFLIAAILVVFWASLMVSIVGPATGRTSFHAVLSIVCCPKSASVPSFPKHIAERRTLSNEIRHRQQRYAYVALVHSLPWAVAAGMALPITFALFHQHPVIPGDSSSHSLVQLNLFFRGLDGLLTIPREYNRSMININKSSVVMENCIPLILLILLPLLVHILICFIFSILLKIATRKIPSNRLEANNMLCTTLTPIFLLIFTEFTSAAIPVIWSIVFPQLFEPKPISRYVYRLILVHLLLDPWLLAWILRALIQQTDCMWALNRSRDPPPQPPPPTVMDHSTMQYPEMARSYLTEANGHEKTNNASIRTQSQLPGFQTIPSSGVRLMSCFPMTDRLPSPVPALTGSHTQPPPSVFMSCVPGNQNLFVSPMAVSSVDSATGYLVPVGSSSFTMPTTQMEQTPVSFSSGMLVRMTTEPLMQTSEHHHSGSTGIPQSNTNDLIPRLCEHHQHLLEQHFSMHQASLPKVGHVPRLLTQPNTIRLTHPSQFPQSTIPQRPQLSEKCWETPHESAQNGSPMELVPMRDGNTKTMTLSGKSPATAVVMAAAAAAVAAQAGNLKEEMPSGCARLVPTPSVAEGQSAKWSPMVDTRFSTDTAGTVIRTGD